MKIESISILLILMIISMFIECNIFDPENQQENDAKLSESFSCYPNPFGNITKPCTNFTYYLSEDSDVQTKIYTKDDKLVWKCHFSKNEYQGKKGLHDGDIVWDGRDVQGEKVVIGIYDVYILTHNGNKYATLKISIIR